MSPTPPLLDDMLVFAEVVSAGGITAAAARLGLRKSTVSRRLAALEERLGTRLLERNTRRLRLTETGREYHAHCARLVAEAREVNRALSESRGTPRGTLRVATFSLLGELLTPVITEFLLRHPQVRVEVSLAEAYVDLVADSYDIALRTGPLPDSSQVARRLGDVRTGYYASPAYLSRRGTPRSPDELEGHECVLVAEPGTSEVWFFAGPRGARTVPVSGRLQVPSVRAGHAAARAGLGLVRLPTVLAVDDVRAGVLVPVLEAVSPPGLPIYAVYPSSRQLPLKVRAFLDTLAQRSAALPWEEPGRSR
ncbi:LysR family transcriptional regulator [Archangium violaceum]|uniref:LysR family transcriptional regulator n=1 Tax=Archangium violaceum TaxID=83451 RepID=UPI00193B6E15|nr:LysR family transcriptional regulator [Archangium violaceum]QRK12560.1 LysR family transcriptional regulator [Archangium violaceum]